MLKDSKVQRFKSSKDQKFEDFVRSTTPKIKTLKVQNFKVQEFTKLESSKNKRNMFRAPGGKMQSRIILTLRGLYLETASEPCLPLQMGERTWSLVAALAAAECWRRSF